MLQSCQTMEHLCTLGLWTLLETVVKSTRWHHNTIPKYAAEDLVISVELGQLNVIFNVPALAAYNFPWKNYQKCSPSEIRRYIIHRCMNLPQSAEQVTAPQGWQHILTQHWEDCVLHPPKKWTSPELNSCMGLHVYVSSQSIVTIYSHPWQL